MPETSPTPHALAPLVVVTAGTAAPGRHARAVREVVESVPRTVDVVALSAAPLQLDRTTARRARVLRVRPSGPGGADEALAGLVAQDRPVTVLDAGLSVERGWHEDVLRLAADVPVVVGRLALGADRLRTWPAGVAALDAPQRAWEAVAGVTARRAPHHLTAVMIVKDEAAVIEDAVTSALPFVDEVVVYDTGSTDGTQDLARACGARVEQGYWDSDFGAARNRAADLATGDWVLVVDADEVVEGDPAALRALLASTAEDTLVATQVSVRWRGAVDGQVVVQVRLYRRSVMRYSGALHEQVVPRDGGVRPPGGDASRLVRLMHSGYTDVAVKEHDKGQRNSEVARRALEAAAPDDPARPQLLANHGRSLVLAGQVEQGLAVLEELLTTSAPPTTLVLAGRSAAARYLVRDAGACARWVDVLEASGEAPGAVVTWRARLASRAGDADAAASALRDLLSAPGRGGRDVWGVPWMQDGAVALLATLDLDAGDTAAALALVRGGVLQRPDTVDLGVLLRVWEAAGEDLADLARQAPAAFLDRCLRDLVAAPTEQALAWFGAHRAAHPDDPRALVAGCVVAPRGAWTTALEWAVAAAEAGLDMNPLREAAEQPHRPAPERALAWAVLADAFGQRDALQRLVDVLEALADDERDAVLQELVQLVPRCVDLLTGAPA